MGDRRRDQQGQEESRRILERVRQETEPLLPHAAAKARDHFAAREAEGEDWTELWGRRIGRVLALVFLAILLVWLWSSLTGSGS